MIKKSFLILLFLIPFTAHSHQADISNTMLVEQENNQWILQINSALTAFQYEVKHNFPDSTYNSPDEFQQLVIDHLKNNLLVCFNQKDTLLLDKAHIKLGHETNVVFELGNIPNKIETLTIKNSSFKDIDRNQSALIVLKKGVTRKQFTLNNNNQHSISLAINNNVITELNGKSKKSSSLLLKGIFLTLLIIGGFIFSKFLRSQKTMST